MKNKILPLSFIISSLLYIQSCAPAYIPNRINAPLFTEAGEVSVDLSVGRSGLDPQFAMSVTENIGFMVNGSLSLPNNTDTTDLDFHRHGFIEAGAGYSKKIGTNQVFEIFGGFGRGFSESYWTNDLIGNVNMKSQYNRFFIQPSFGITQKNIDFAFSNRFVLVQMSINNQYSNNFTVNQFDYFWEPVVTFRAGGTYVKFIMQTGLSVPLIQIPENSYEYRKFIFSIGMRVRFGKKYDN